MWLFLNPTPQVPFRVSSVQHIWEKKKCHLSFRVTFWMPRLPKFRVISCQFVPTEPYET